MKRIFPTPTLLQSKPYKHSTEGVDVRDTWKKYGWQPRQPTVPASNDNHYQQKGK